MGKYSEQEIEMRSYANLLEGGVDVDFLVKGFLTPDRILYYEKSTHVYWQDGTVTKVCCADGEDFHYDQGFAMALAKKVFGKRADYMRVVNEGLQVVPVRHVTRVAASKVEAARKLLKAGLLDG